MLLQQHVSKVGMVLASLKHTSENLGKGVQMFVGRSHDTICVNRVQLEDDGFIITAVILCVVVHCT